MVDSTAYTVIIFSNWGQLDDSYTTIRTVQTFTDAQDSNRIHAIFCLLGNKRDAYRIYCRCKKNCVVCSAAKSNNRDVFLSTAGLACLCLKFTGLLLKHQAFPWRFVHLFVVIHNLQPGRFCLFACQSTDSLAGAVCALLPVFIFGWISCLFPACSEIQNGRWFCSFPVADPETWLLNDICYDFPAV